MEASCFKFSLRIRSTSDVAWGISLCGIGAAYGFPVLTGGGIELGSCGIEQPIAFWELGRKSVEEYSEKVKRQVRASDSRRDPVAMTMTCPRASMHAKLKGFRLRILEQDLGRFNSEFFLQAASYAVSNTRIVLGRFSLSICRCVAGRGQTGWHFW